MTCFDMNLRKFNLDETKLEYLNHGECANVFRYNDIILKEYFPHTSEYCKISLSMFKTLKSIQNSHFIELINIYSEMRFIDLVKYCLTSSFKTSSYTAKYYEEQDVNVLIESIDYLLDNFRELEILVEEISKEKIYMNDLKRNNTILTSDNIIIIDPDLFSVSTAAIKKVLLQNKRNLLNLFKDICLKCAEKQNYSKEIQDKIKFDLTLMDVNENTGVTYELSKILSSSKRPIDYLMK